MSLLPETEFISCPYCGEQFEIVIDISVEEQSYIEDCYVCCRPISLSVVVDDLGGVVSVVARDENEC
mgnify:FL=1